MRVIFITGGTSGIGLATAVAFCNAAYENNKGKQEQKIKVIVCGRTREKWEKAQTYIQQYLKTLKQNQLSLKQELIEYIPCDIRVESNVKQVLEEILRKYGRIDVCFNNAGVQPGVVFGQEISIGDFHLDSYVGDDGSINYTLPPPQPYNLSYDEKTEPLAKTEIGASPFRENEIATSCIGTFYCLKWELELIYKYNPKDVPVSIVNTSSRNGILPDAHRPLYAASKAFIISLTRSLSNQVATRCIKENRAMIRINCVSPGPVDTPLEYTAYGFPNLSSNSSSEKQQEYTEYERRASKGVPMQRTGKPEDIANAVIFLSDPDKAAYITGSNLSIDGGFVASPLF